MDVISLVVAVTGTAATVIIGCLAFALSRHAGRYAAARSIGDLQTAVARYRAEHPDVIRYGSRWRQQDNAVLYGWRDTPDATTIVRYSAYIDLGLEFCNTALAASASGLVRSSVFEGHYRPLVRLFLTENYPFVHGALNGPYLSSYVRAEVASATRSGWDWELEHRRLAGPEDHGPAAAATSSGEMTAAG